ncbi:winged helix DNA-binding domain-containing protein [Streptomyces sp. HNM0645]|uniref:winged helix DNA-binding domain-containing protein n=1 Tax=Streptomyces sp. HNM0645 TaxID=2782343 RepID=UPI0024B668A7|nr:winged helix DNA-binding domain-containing protein [Streptomyces sp. HNM0645]MDI9884422.1 winged helix DNA-binding domain-containing protein [Streptomyces sp. HNM0645]
MAPKTPPVLGPRALGRATLDRQLLLRRDPGERLTAEAAVEHLIGLQAQNVGPPYHALAARLHGFRPQELSELMESRAVARMVTMRSTLHTHGAHDCLTLRPFAQPGGPERELRMFTRRLGGIDPDRLAAVGRELLEERPRPVGELRDALLAQWPDADPLALTTAVRCMLPLVQTTPRGLWGRAGQVTLTTAEQWFGRPVGPAPEPETVVRRYLAAFGPASVRDMQTWSGLTRLKGAFERLRPELAAFHDDKGVELFDLPEGPRPDPDTPAPPRLLPEFDNLLLSHADRSRFVPPDFRDRTWKGNQARSVLLVDGRVAGIWRTGGRGGTGGRKRDRDAEAGGALTLTVRSFVRLTAAQRTAVAEEAGRLLAIVAPGADHDVRFGEFTE